MRATRYVALSLLVVLSLALLLHGTLPLVTTGSWTPASNLADGRTGSAAALLQDGRILFTGGTGSTGTLASAELFNTDGSVTSAAPMQDARSNHAAITLQDEKVLVAGGTTSGGGITSAAEIYDPASNAWTPVAGGMTAPRSNHTASLLKDGTVLIAGGQSTTGPLNSLEIYDPAAGAFVALTSGMLSSARQDHAAAVLSDGRVLMAGGSDGTNALSSTDVYNPLTGSVSAAGNMSGARTKLSATTLLDGRVLAAGGNDGTNDLATAEIYDPATGAFTATASPLGAARSSHLAFLLPNNNGVLIVGGSSAAAPLASAELFYSWTGAFTATGAMASPRTAAAGAALKQDGYLLVAGGSDGTNPLASSELYGFATVKTDKADYAPGETVTISGSGWQPGETVTLSLVESPLLDTHGPFTATADSFGNISNIDFVPDDHDVSILFYLTAKGSVSQAETTFSDSKPNTVTVGTQSPNPVAPGSSAAYTVTVNFNGNGTSCTSPLSVNTALPTGVTASFSPSSLTSTGGNVNSTLTISTTNATPPGSTNFTVLAGNGGGTCQAGTATGSGTLVVVEPTTTTLTSSVNPSVFGQSTTLTATVAQTAGTTTPTGTVTFKDGAVTLGTVALNGSGVATLSTSALTVAGSPHSLTASYAGVANTFGASSSNTVTQVVNQASTTTTVALTTGTSPSVFGQSLMFTATVAAVAPGAGTPTGTVTFKDGASPIGTGTLNGSGQATLTTTTLAVGPHSITAVYGADTNFTGSTSSTLSQTVNQASTTTAITAHTPSPSVVGQAVTITLTVTANAPGAGTPTGNVTVSDGAGNTCTASVATGTCSITFPTAGTKSLTASYAGDTNFTSSTSTPATSHTVNPASTTTTITAHTPSPSIVGQPVTVNFTVTVNSPGSGTIPGADNVTVSDGAGDTCTATVTAGNCQLTPATTGIKTLTATYAGSTNFATSTSAGVSHTVNNPVPTTTSISPTTKNAGDATFTLTVNGTNFVATSTVNFNGSARTTTFLTANQVTASITAADIATGGTFGITVVNPTPGGGTSNPQTLTVNNLAPTTTSISPTTKTAGDAAFTLTVNGTNFVTTSVVNFNGSARTTTFVSATQVTAAITAADVLIAGPFPITVTNPTPGGGTSNAQTLTVNPKLVFTTATPFATLTGLCSPQVSVQIQNGNGTAASLSGPTILTLSSSSGGGAFFSDAGCGTVIPGNTLTIGAGSSTASFFYKDTAIGSPVITVASTGLTSVTQTEAITSLRFGSGAFSVSTGACSSAISLQSANAASSGPTSLTQATIINLSSSSAGGKFYSDAGCATQITSTIIGPAFDAGHDSPNFFYKDTTAGTPTLTASAGTASAAQAETVNNPVPTTTSISPASKAVGDADFTLTVNGTNFVTTSVVRFAGSPRTTSFVSATQVTALITASDLTTAGTFNITVFNPAPGGGTSNPQTFTVNNPAPTTISISPTNKNVGDAGFTLTVNGTNFVTTSLVQFAGSNRTTSFVSANQLTASILASDLTTVGTFNITVFNPAPGGGTSNAQTFTVNNPVTMTTVISSLPGGSTFGQSVTFTSTVTSASVVPTGSVTFYDGACGGTFLAGPIALDGAGKAGFISTLTAGSHNIFACYMPTGIYQASSGSVTQSVIQATPVITWADPADITYGTALGATQLNATANVAGTFTYTPAAGTVLPAGNGQALKADFVPADANYSPVTGITVHINVTASALYVVANDKTRAFSDSDPTFDASYFGFQNGDTQLASLMGTLMCLPTAVSNSPAGTYAINCSGQTSANYNIIYVNGQLTITNPLTSIAVTPVNPTIHIGEHQQFTAVGTFQQGSRNLGSNSGSWASGTGMPVALADAAAAELNGHLYVVGGSTDGSTPTGAVQVYDPVSGTWASPAPGMPTPRMFARAAVLGGRLYVVGGTAAGGAVVGTLEVYDPATNSWSAKASMTTARFDMAVGVINGKLYVAGGSTGSVVGALEVYDPATNSWSSKAMMPTARSGAGAGVINGIFYVAGGSASGGPSMTLEAYNAVGDSWSTLASFGAAQPLAGGAVLNGALYVVSGSDVTVQSYDPTGNAWTPRTSIPNPLQDGQPVAIGGLIYAAGNTASGASTTLQIYTPDEMTWGSGTPAVATIDTGGNATGISAGFSTITASSTMFVGVSGSTLLTVEKIKPIITWANPADIIYGAALSATQLNATATTNASPVPGSFVYTPAAGTVLNAGSHTLSVTFTPTDGTKFDTADATVTINVNPATPTVAVGGGPFTYDGDPHSATAAATGVGGASVSGSFSFTYTPGPSEPVNAGTYSVTANFTTSDPNYTNATGTGSITIKKANASISVTPYSVTYDGNPHTATGTATGVKGEALSGLDLSGTTHTNAGTTTDTWTFTDVTGNYYNTNGSVSDVIKKATPTISVTPYSVTYDGNPHSATATATGVGGASVSGSFTFIYTPGGSVAPVNAGMYLVSVSFNSTDPNYNYATGAGSITINPAPTVTALYSTLNQSAIPATVTLSATVTNTLTSAIPVGIVTFVDTSNGNASLGTQAVPGGSAVTGLLLGMGTHVIQAVYAPSSNFVPSSSSVTSPVVMITGPPSGAVQAVNTSFSFSANLTDSNTSSPSAQWAFDATTSIPGTVGSSTITGSYTFLSAGVFGVTLTFNDGLGGIVVTNTVSAPGAPANLMAQVVVYDPSGGFVTGGGWINSPAGAYTPNPSLSGKATFGFVSKYLKGATVPTGETEFNFQVASFDFHSTVYQWLVVSGSQAQYKGTGTINGAGNYNFLLTASDGSPDGFRIKITDPATNAVIYDNLPAATDSVGNTQNIGGGSIVIHK